MFHPCPQCGQSLKFTSPGTHQCPRCGALIEIKPEEFAWEAGEHLNDFGNHLLVDADQDPVDSESGDGMDSAAAPSETPIAAIVSAGEVPVESEAGDKCEICIVREATQACQSCRKLVCPSCSSLDSGGLPICHDCRHVFISDESHFENAGRAGFLKSLFGSIKSLIFRPSEFFGRMPIPGRFWPGVMFGVIVLYPIRVLAVIMLAYTMQGQIAEIESQLGIAMPEFIRTMISQPSFLAGMLVSAVIFQPIFIIMDIIVSGAINHLFLIILGQLHGRFEDTIRVVGYAKLGETPTIIPIIGPFIAIGWTVVLLALGFHKIHRIPLWKASVAAAAPILLCCCGLMAFFFAIFTFIFSQTLV